VPAHALRRAGLLIVAACVEKVQAQVLLLNKRAELALQRAGTSCTSKNHPCADRLTLGSTAVAALMLSIM
jgi:hypothetical protein